MARICWKCWKEIPREARFCPHCGAGFASDDAKYQTDGRTVSTDNPDAYLTAPPPKYKRGKAKYVAAIAIAAVAIVAVLALMGSATDVEYDYEVTGSGQVIGGTSDYVLLHVELANVSGSAVDMGRLDLLLDVGGTLYPPINPLSGTIYKGYAFDGEVLFYIDPEDSGKPVELVVKSEKYRVKLNNSLI